MRGKRKKEKLIKGGKKEGRQKNKKRKGNKIGKKNYTTKCGVKNKFILYFLFYFLETLHCQCCSSFNFN
jgi:hypothetical protein